MIVADTNLVAYLHLPGSKSEIAEAVLRRDSEWCVPPLWRSEFRSILFACMRTQGMSVPLAEAHWWSALEHLSANQMEPDPIRVLSKASGSKISAYDAEFVVLAEQLGVPLVTSDRQVLKEFPEIAIPPEEFAAE